MHVISISSWHDLEAYGIFYLTGEADRTGLRCLCDVTTEGRVLVCEVLGIPYTTEFAPGWNKADRSSVTIPYDLLQSLSVFALMFGKDRCPEVAIIGRVNSEGTMTSNREVMGLERGDSTSEWAEHFDFLRECGFNVRIIKINGSPGEGSRATHQMSGRVA